MKDAKNGTGILILSNKEKFYGTFENDIINGKGSFMKTDGTIISGIWENNKLV